ncbi:MAG TPA: hypothetical protein VF476_02020 [Chitinophagaceae bacterium]
MKKITQIGVVIVTTAFAITGCTKEQANLPEANESVNAANIGKKEVLMMRTTMDVSGAVVEFTDFLKQFHPEPWGPGLGFRAMVWDIAPFEQTNINNFPGDYFNDTDPAGPIGRKRGMICSTPGTGFRISDNDFSDIDPSYADQFEAFSIRKTFSAVGSNITDVTFKVPGTNTDAYVNGFGVVFSDVDNGASTRLEFFNGNTSLGVYMAAPCKDGQFSFLGVCFPNERVTRVRITAGKGILGAGNRDQSDGGGVDLVVMDDFYYDEPKAIQQ